MKPEQYPEAVAINAAIQNAQRILIMQADNPDGDSIGSALALEEILGAMGKEPILYCGVNVPTYLHYFQGWDRIQNDIPKQFDLSIIVDMSADSLFDSLNKSTQKNVVTKKPAIIIDHHQVPTTITFAQVVCNYPVVATAEVLYELSQQLNWHLTAAAKKTLVAAIMSDSLGLTSEGTTARSISIIAELVEGGVSLAELENERRALMRRSPEIQHYKGRLLERIEYFNEDQIAIITIPWKEIEQYSHEYNPSMLVLDDMRQTTNTDIAVAFKLYPDGRITAKIRCNYGIDIANKLAEHFGGGGHKYASGFRVTDGRSLEEVKSECIRICTDLLGTLKK